ncbi:Uncharacterised protein [Mycobacterium tuberculosis]|nr:Uncharacterised protein [Mycobacterium tuberculosis]
MLLRLAGRLPDEVLAEERHWLAIGRLDYIGRTIPVAATTLGVPLTDADLAVLRDLRDRYRLDGAALASVGRQEGEPDTPYRFVPAPLGRPDTDTGGSAHAVDALDRAVIDAVATEHGTVELVRSYRYHRDLPVMPPKRVYLVRTDPGVEPYLLTLDLQAVMARHGEPDPQAEVYAADAELPPYHREALDAGAPLWSRPDSRDGSTDVLRLARTRDEAHLYMDLHPCQRCGSVEVTWKSGLRQAGGELVRAYSGPCGQCGDEREFVFRLPEPGTVPVSGGRYHFGGDAPSELLDAGEWLRVADLTASNVPVDHPTAALNALSIAVAAMNEVLKFIPPGADRVPDTAFWTEQGREVRAREPGRFDRERLAIVRDGYRSALVARTEEE